MFAQSFDSIDKPKIKDNLEICQMAKIQFFKNALSIFVILWNINFENFFIFYFDIKQRVDFILNFDNALFLFKELLSLMRQSGDMKKFSAYYKNKF